MKLRRMEVKPPLLANDSSPLKVKTLSLTNPPAVETPPITVSLTMNHWPVSADSSNPINHSDVASVSTGTGVLVGTGVLLGISVSVGAFVAVGIALVDGTAVSVGSDVGLGKTVVVTVGDSVRDGATVGTDVRVAGRCFRCRNRRCGWYGH